MPEPHIRLVMPHQLFLEHLDAASGTVFVLVEHDLMFRQHSFHAQKLILHRVSMRRFADRLREAGFEVEYVATDAERSSREQLTSVVRDRLGSEGGSVTAYDVVDDWLSQDLTATLGEAGHELSLDEVWETPNFLTSRAQIEEFFGDTSGPAAKAARMQHFYSWQRRRLDVLMEGDEPVGGRWSFDEDNRKKLPRNHPVPGLARPEQHAYVDDAIAWVREEFPDAPGNPDTFAWPTSHEEAQAAYDDFLAERLADFGPYEDAISAEHGTLFHSLLTPGLNIGLLSPEHVLSRVLEVAGEEDTPLSSLEGFVRQVIGWREYMRATYVRWGRRMRSRNVLEHSSPLADGWWDATTGLEPVDLVLRRVLDTGYAHHIERLMVFGNAQCLLRTDPEAAYEWFMEMFVDAYDWVMVPNVYAMSQYAAGPAITTKPYVSGSNYLKKMSDLPKGEWTAVWDALYWTFVRDHLDVFSRNPRSKMIATLYDRMDPAKKAAHVRLAHEWIPEPHGPG